VESFDVGGNGAETNPAHYLGPNVEIHSGHKQVASRGEQAADIHQARFSLRGVKMYQEIVSQNDILGPDTFFELRSGDVGNKEPNPLPQLVFDAQTIPGILQNAVCQFDWDASE